MTGTAAAARSFDADALDRRDPRRIEAILPFVRWANQRYLRLRVEGLEHVPNEPALYVGNHNGGIAGPDVCCTLGTLWDARGAHAPLFALAHDFAMRQLPRFGALIQPFGALRASRTNALRALRAGGQVLVYPGGDLDAYRHARHRDRFVIGARSGFVRVAQEADVPIVPVVAYGAHRSAFIFHEGEGIARLLRLEQWGRLTRFPLALALPWGVSVGPWLPYLPLPFPVQLRILPPIAAARGADPDRVRERVRRRVQAALDELAHRSRVAR